MRYWWVNQNQTYRHEIRGGYLWSPKRKKGNQRNPFYESMREVAPGDIVFSFCDTRIAAIGIAQTYCYESPKPLEFGSAGLNWHAIGWKVDVRFQELENRMRPKDHMDSLAHYLPERYSPLMPNGNGLQSVYLTEVPTTFAEVIFRLIGPEASVARDVTGSSPVIDPHRPDAEVTLIQWEKHVEQQIQQEPQLDVTEKQSLILARRGQGVFRANVREIEHSCRITKVERPEHLIASHCKPWRDSTNEERLDGENGLLLTPTIDHLFDKGFIAFEGNGKLLISPVAHPASLGRMGIPVNEEIHVGAFTQRQRVFLEYHRDNVFRSAHRSPRR
ncbi:MAG: HNH endonuclease [Bryobacterales bacterium]|nr:HNH endonuclease [Gammaproteobacteria bacterium]MCZ2076547.1 HNH endonuclease [Bryobacterales bacterium]